MIERPSTSSKRLGAGLNSSRDRLRLCNNWSCYKRRGRRCNARKDLRRELLLCHVRKIAKWFGNDWARGLEKIQYYQLF